MPQSNPGWAKGYVPSATEWNGWWSNKQDAIPVLSSDPAPQTTPQLYYYTPDNGTTYFVRVMFPNGKYAEISQPP